MTYLDPVEPVYPWSYTCYVVEPVTYLRVHTRLAAYWVGAFLGPVPRPAEIVFTAL